MRVILHNHLTRSVGRFRTTAGVRDHSDCGCGCGGNGDCHSHDEEKRTIKRNIYGNWVGYVGGKRVEEFGDNASSERVAREWAAGSEREDMPRQRDGLAQAEMGIDVTFVKGDKRETRHYSVPRVTVDPHGRPPSNSFVALHLKQQPSYHDMVNGGWKAEKAEGYYKREHRDVGYRV